MTEKKKICESFFNLFKYKKNEKKMNKYLYDINHH